MMIVDQNGFQMTNQIVDTENKTCKDFRQMKLKSFSYLCIMKFEKGKKLLTIVLATCMTFCLSGCQSSHVTYSNLVDEKTRNEVAEMLIENKLPKKDVQKVMDWVDEFNSISREYSYKKGFVRLPKDGVSCDTLYLDDTAKSYVYLNWLNCRLTAFSLIQDVVETSKDENTKDTWLMFDVEALNTVEQFKTSEEKKKDFVTLFHSIDVSNEDTLKNQEDKIVETLKSRHTQLKTDTISIASIYLHVPEENIRFVGHTGILVNTEDGCLYFEKYSNIAPFQATKFKDKKQVKKYLLSRPDLYGDGSELDPIVTINDEILGKFVR